MRLTNLVIWQVPPGGGAGMLRRRKQTQQQIEQQQQQQQFSDRANVSKDGMVIGGGTCPNKTLNFKP
jgi:hypothetical protein